MTEAPGTGGPHLGDASSALLDGELGDAEAQAARAHLAVCPTCEAERAEIGQARSWLRGLPPVEPPADFFEDLIATASTDSPAASSEPAPAPAAGASSPSHRATVTSIARGSVPERSAGRHRRRRWAGLVAISGCAAATLVVLGLVAPHDPSTSPPVAHFIEAHETAVVGGDPVTHLAPAVVPAMFGR